jgi:Na+-transporting methylmalonyl-CoA/oxaloacetate decarboxylase gamma subunit
MFIGVVIAIASLALIVVAIVGVAKLVKRAYDRVRRMVGRPNRRRRRAKQKIQSS